MRSLLEASFWSSTVHSGVGRHRRFSCPLIDTTVATRRSTQISYSSWTQSRSKRRCRCQLNVALVSSAGTTSPSGEKAVFFLCSSSKYQNDSCEGGMPSERCAPVVATVAARAWEGSNVGARLKEGLDSFGALHHEPHRGKLAGTVAHDAIEALVLVLECERLQPREGCAEAEVEFAPSTHGVRLVE
eukprot:scaffold124615_cov30-Tisochrysis_lutea.AAC.5